MAADQRGERNRPIYLGSGASADAEDLTELGQRIADLGTRRVGTTDERNALDSAERFDGLLFFDTTQSAEYVCVSGAWKATTTGIDGRANYSGNLAPGTSDTMTVTFPLGQFVKPPKVNGISTNSRVTVAISALSKDAVTFALGNWTGGTAANPGIYWTADARP